MFYRLLFGKEAEYLSKSSHLVAKEIRDLRDYIKLFKGKVRLLKNVVERANKQRNVEFSKKVFKEMEDHFLQLEGLEFIIESRDIAKDKKLVKELNLEEKEDPELTAPIESIKKHLHQLFQVRRLVIRLVRRQIRWVKDHKDMEFPIKKEAIQPLVRLVNQEGQLLFRYGLSGFQGEKGLLIEIYNEIMPLKERVKKEKIAGGRATDPTVWTWVDGRIRVIKKFGSLAKGSKWTYDQARSRLENIKRFYTFLKAAGVSVPDHKALAIVEQWKKTPSGLKPTGYYQVVLSQEHLGRNVALIFQDTNNKNLIRKIYRQILKETFKAVVHNEIWMMDFKPQNFCKNGHLTYVDTDPIHLWRRDISTNQGNFLIPVNIPIKDQIRLMKMDIREWGEKDWRWWRFKRGDSRGNFVELLEQTVALKIDLKQMFEDEMLNFFKKHGLKKEFKFIDRFTRTPMYEFNLFRLVKQESPRDAGKAELMLKRKNRVSFAKAI